MTIRQPSGDMDLGVSKISVSHYSESENVTNRTGPTLKRSKGRGQLADRYRLSTLAVRFASSHQTSAKHAARVHALIFW